MANNDVMGLDRWSVYIATTETAVQRYAYNASIAGIIVGSLVFVGLIVFSVYVRAHIEGSNKLLLTMEKRVVDYFRQTFQKSLADREKTLGSPLRKRAPDSEQDVESSIYESDVRDLNGYFLIFTPWLLDRFFYIDTTDCAGKYGLLV